MKNLKTLLFLLILPGIAFIACKKSRKVTETTYNYDVTLSGANEVPANSSTATGKLVGSYTKSTKVLTFTLNYSGITPTNWHIHKGAPGVSGPIQVDLSPIVPSPLQKTITLTAEQETDLLSGNWYVNVHSAALPDGEIRAQLAAPVVVVRENPSGGGY